MNQKLVLKSPLDLTSLEEDDDGRPPFQATVFPVDDEDSDEMVYALRQFKDFDPEDPHARGEPVILCHSAAQLSMIARGVRMKPGNEEKDLQEFLWRASGELMSRRVFNQDFYDSGRESMGYELAWLPGGIYNHILSALESSGNYGLAALMREGRVETK